MGTRQNQNELLSALEEIRSTKYPEISTDVIKRIVASQYNNQDERTKARTETLRIIAEYINSQLEKEE